MNKKILVTGIVLIAVVVIAFRLGKISGNNSIIEPDYIVDEGSSLDSEVERTTSKNVAEKPSSESILGEEVGSQVIVNGLILDQDQLNSLQATYGVTPLPGNYWYDSRSGMYGNIGGAATNVMYPNHNFGVLSSNASYGTSGLYVNGRQLTTEEAYLLASLFGYSSPLPGSYWLDANGDIGVEGYNVALGNVYAAIAAADGSGGDNIWSRGVYSGGNYYTGAGGQVTEGYVSVPGVGPISHGF